MNFIRTIVSSFILIFVCGLSYAETLFLDGFESADMGTTSVDGFFWEANNSTSIVTQDTVDGPVAVFNNNIIYNPHSTTMDDGSIRDWQAKEGSYSLRFRYASGRNQAEQRYGFGTGYPELWVSYWIRMPENYYRPQGNNNKWFNMQMAPMTQYEDATVSRIEMQDRPNDTNNGNMDINIQFRNGTDGTYINSDSYKNFVTLADRGRWMHIVYHTKASTSNSTTDGFIRMYRRWSNESSYTLINNLSNINVGIGSGSVTAGTLGWASGYLMGWANTPYLNDTEWLLDNFTISDTSPLNIITPAPPSNLMLN